MKTVLLTLKEAKRKKNKILTLNSLNLNQISRIMKMKIKNQKTSLSRIINTIRKKNKIRNWKDFLKKENLLFKKKISKKSMITLNKKSSLSMRSMILIRLNMRPGKKITMILMISESSRIIPIMRKRKIISKNKKNPKKMKWVGLNYQKMMKKCLNKD